MTKYIGKDATVMLNGEGKVVTDLGSTSKSGAKPMNSTSVTIRLPQLSSDLLREVIEKRAPELLPMLREGSEVVIREDQKRDIQELIDDEVSKTGLRAGTDVGSRSHSIACWAEGAFVGWHGNHRDVPVGLLLTNGVGTPFDWNGTS